MKHRCPYCQAPLDIEKMLRGEFKPRRSTAQQASLEIWCRRMAETLNDAGLDKRIVLKHRPALPWTGDSFKSDVWRACQVALTGHKSTTKPTPAQYVEIYDTLNRFFAERYGIHVAWPSFESLI